MLSETSQRSLELDKLVTIAIPTLNEEQGIGMVLEELRHLGLASILVVDGYSSDKTVEIAMRYGAKVLFQHGRGKTGAIKTAIDAVETPYMIIMDGDYTYDASCISRLLQYMNSYDEVIGARVANSNSMNRLHKFGNKVITKIFNLLMNTSLSDVCSGMYLLRTSSARELNLQTAGFDVEAEIAAQIASVGSITEVPVIYRARLGKQKLSTWKHGFRIVRSILGLARSYNPGTFYSMLGSLLLIPAGPILFNSFMEWILAGRITGDLFLVGIAMLMVAIQAMSVGVLSLIFRRTELRIARRLRKLGA